MISTLELARICGVSQGTVDRALHGRPGIAEATRQAILRAATRHGHRPHPGMREILDGRSATVLAVLPAANNIFFMDLVAAVAEALAQRKLTLQIALVRDQAGLLAALEDAAARRHRLAFFVPPEENIAVPRELSRHLPLGALISPCRGTNVPFLSPDEKRTGRSGVEYLHQRGHRRILFISSRRQAYAIRARAAGYRERMREFGLRAKVVFSTDPDDWGAMPSAVFCHNDWIASQTLLTLRQKRIDVPGEISVLGVDNSQTLAALFPDLTTLAYPIPGLVRAILDRLDGQPFSPASLRFEVVERGTVRAVKVQC
jgi:LacI family transcriptional regulator